MKAIIMAGGEGTRLRPLTSSIPKPMVPIANRPVMEHAINLLNKYGINDIGVTTYYLPTIITDYFGDGDKFGVNLSYYIEETPLGTGGSVLNAKEFLDDTFIVISGDALTDIDINKALSFHKLKGSKATLVLKREPIPLEYGIIITDKDGRIVRFLEKPSWGEVFSDTINTGIYILEPEIFNYYKKGENFDFSKDLFPKLLRDNIPMYGYITDSYWCDIGDLDSYRQTQFDILDRAVDVKFDYNEISPGVWVGPGTSISEGVKIVPPVYIGSDCTIKSNVVIDSYTVIGSNCEIEENTSIKRSVIWDKSHIGKNCQCRGTTICNNVFLKTNANLFEGSVIGSECILFPNTIVKPDIKIWPNKQIKEDTIVSKNLVWGTKVTRKLFGNRDITGEINIDITPEFASMLGATYATVIKNNGPVLVSCDNENSSILIKNSILSGALSTGANVISIENIVTPISRFAVRFYHSSGGIHISCDNRDTNRIHIELFNKNGGNIDRKEEKKIEHLFLRSDFERCNSNMVKDVMRIDNFSSFYIHTNEGIVKNISDIKNKKVNLLIGSSSDTVLSLASSYLQHIGCKVDIDSSFDEYESIGNYALHFCNMVNDNYDFGILLDENGENIILVDEAGSMIEGDKYTILSSLITLKTGSNKRLVVPYTATRSIEKIAEEYSAEVIRTKSSLSDIMNEMLRGWDSNQQSIIQYVLNFDGIAASGIIIAFLTEKALTLKELAREIPDFHIRKHEIPCDFDVKGSIIRQLIEENKDNSIELFEGIKINNSKGWTLVLPDNEKPVLNIYTEGFSEEFADDLTELINEKVNKLLDERKRDVII